MAEVHDYIAKRAETFGVLQSTIAGLHPIDAAGNGIANLLTVGIGSALEQAGLVGKVTSWTLKGKGGVISGSLNVIQDNDSDQFKVFATGFSGAVAGQVFTGATIGGAVTAALAVVLSSPSLASIGALTGLVCLAGAAHILVGEAVTTIADQFYSTFVTKEFDSTFDAEQGIYVCETNWNLQDNLYGNMWTKLTYLTDIFRSNPKNLDYIIEQEECNGFDLIGYNTEGLAFLKYRKAVDGSGLDRFEYGGTLEKGKFKVPIARTSDIEAMVDLIKKERFQLITVDSVEHEVTSLKHMEINSNYLVELAKTDGYYADALFQLNPYVIANDPTVDPLHSLDLLEDVSEYFFKDRAGFLFALHREENPTSIRFEDRGQDIVVPGDGQAISSNYVLLGSDPNGAKYGSLERRFSH